MERLKKFNSLMEIIDFNFVKKKLFVNKKLFLTVSANIDNCLINNDLFILLLNGNDLGSDRNIICYDINKVFKWQISSPPQLHSHNYYTTIYFRDVCFQAYSINGIEATIDVINGNIINSELIK